MNSEVLKEAGISTEPEPQSQEALQTEESAPGQKELSQLEKLEADLKTAVETENYEKAAKIRDRISKMKG
ncbi:MAG: UvrB/UvrC motif-containing protein [Balneolaceae bacterium]